MANTGATQQQAAIPPINYSLAAQKAIQRSQSLRQKKYWNIFLTEGGKKKKKENGELAVKWQDAKSNRTT